MNQACTRLASVAATLLLAVTTAGCGKAEPERVAVFPTTGKITFKGQPTIGATVLLHPKAPQEKVPAPRASVAPDGTFKLSTFNTGDGAPEGEYVLTVKWYKPVKNGGDVVSGPNVIPAKYTQAESSTIVVRVAAGENSLDPIKL
jgi:hypothetical protein